MARGVSLHVGINRVSVGAFLDEPLVGCENDAVAMRDLALKRGFKPEDATLLLGEEAKFDRVVEEIVAAAEGPARLVAGDIFLFTFSGHGSFVPNPELEETLTDEPDGNDESLVLFDRQMLDDYLRRVLWPKFEKGVRIVGVTDSCHSASVLYNVSVLHALPLVNVTVTEHLAAAVSDASGAVASARAVKRVMRFATHFRSQIDRPDAPAGLAPGEEMEVAAVGPRDRAISDESRIAHREAFKSFYEDLKIPSLAAAPPIRADLLFMAACQDGKKTKDGVIHTDGLLHGAFTSALLKVWNNGAFEGHYVTFLNAISARIGCDFPGQLPVLTPEVPPAFSSQQPFSI